MSDYTKANRRPKNDHKHRITKRQVDAIAAYVAELQENMRLCQWQLRVMRGTPPIRSTNAVLWMADEAHEADLYVDRVTFVPKARHEQRHILVHELCHMVHQPVDLNVGLMSQPKARGKAGLAMAAESYTQAMETCVDDFARLIAEHQPLPPAGWLS